MAFVIASSSMTVHPVNKLIMTLNEINDVK